MISDFQILGIEETDDRAAIKRAYRRRAKQLHPDTADSGVLVNNHFLFVEVCKAYGRLTGRAPAKGSAAGDAVARPVAKAGARTVSPTAAQPAAPTASAGVIKHADPAYVYYKNGITIFGKIHPSEWKRRGRVGLSDVVDFDEADQREAQRKVMELVALFPKAYWFFSVVANEYPESPWAADARDKMALIEGRMVRYKSIIESFSSWKDFAASEKERFQTMMKATKENYANRHDRMRDGWDGED